MTRDFTQDEADRHNALTAKGWSLIEGQVILHESGPNLPLGWLARWRLRRAARCFTQALATNPEGWSSMYALGKIYQRLGDQIAAFEWFAKAHRLNPDQPDVAREAGIAAMDIGRVEEALAFCRAAVACKPEDHGLVCNLALAYCLMGNDEEAERCAAEAVQREPADEISQWVLQRIRETASGVRPRPKTLSETFPHD